MTPQNSTWSDLKSWLRRSSFFFKLAAVAFLGLILLIPLGMVDGLLRERLQRQYQAVEEIRGTWGKEQTIIGPILKLPYKREIPKTRQERIAGNEYVTVHYTETDRGTIYLLPQSLSVDGALDPLVRYRGIYETVVYDASIQITGAFPQPDLAGTELKPEHLLWNEGTVMISISDLRGASRQLEITLGDQQLNLLPGSNLNNAPSGLHAETTGLKAWTGSLPFAFNLQLHGSGRLQVAPLGVETDVSLSSPWPDPSFQGAFLPAGTEIGAEGFQANWQVSYYGRSYPQQVIQTKSSSTLDARVYHESIFGVELAQLIDTYRPVERAIKYGVLFLVLVFGTFFLFELIAEMRVHTLQYTLIGGALILFYLALLALSEFIGFASAYAIGAAGATLLITFYSRSILGSGRSTLIIFGGLAGVYSFLFVTLRMQDYALVSGTIGLFLLLAVAMYVTRHLHRREPETALPTTPDPAAPTAG